MNKVYLDTNAFIKLFLPEEEGRESIERVALSQTEQNFIDYLRMGSKRVSRRS